MTHINAIFFLVAAGHFTFGGLMAICFAAGLLLAIGSRMLK